LLLIEFIGGFEETRKRTLDRLVIEAAYKSDNMNLESAARDVEKNLTHMVEIFNEREPLLSSQGPTTVYYWLVREFHKKYKTKIRGFLVNFNDERKVNRQRAKDKLPDVDDELLNYDIMDRNVNSKDSQVGRYRILIERFAKFLNITPSGLQE